MATTRIERRFSFCSLHLLCILFGSPPCIITPAILKACRLAHGGSACFARARREEMERSLGARGARLVPGNHFPPPTKKTPLSTGTKRCREPSTCCVAFAYLGRDVIKLPKRLAFGMSTPPEFHAVVLFILNRRKALAGWVVAVACLRPSAADDAAGLTSLKR
jgi:hypothetical protein